MMMIGRDEGAADLHLLDEALDHFLGDFEVGDDAIAHRADGLHVDRRLAKHHLGFLADRVNDLAAVLVHIGNDRGFIELDAVTLHVDQRVRRPQVDRHVRGHQAEEFAEHGHEAPDRATQRAQILTLPVTCLVFQNR